MKKLTSMLYGEKNEKGRYDMGRKFDKKSKQKIKGHNLVKKKYFSIFLYIIICISVFISPIMSSNLIGTTSTSADSAGITEFTPIGIQKHIDAGQQVNDFNIDLITGQDELWDYTTAKITGIASYHVDECQNAEIIRGNGIEIDGDVNSAIKNDDDASVRFKDYYIYNPDGTLGRFSGFDAYPPSYNAIEAVHICTGVSANSFGTIGSSHGLTLFVRVPTGQTSYLIEEHPSEGVEYDFSLEIDDPNNVVLSAVQAGYSIESLDYMMYFTEGPFTRANIKVDYIDIYYEYNQYEMDFYYKLTYDRLESDTYDVSISFQDTIADLSILVYNYATESWVSKSVTSSYESETSTFAIDSDYISESDDILIRFKKDQYDGYENSKSQQRVLVDKITLTTEDITPPEISLIAPQGLQGNQTPEVVCEINDLYLDKENAYVEIGDNSFQLEQQTGSDTIFRLDSNGRDWLNWQNFYRSLDSGPLDMIIEAWDLAGNEGTLMHSYDVDKTIPVLWNPAINASLNITGEFAPQFTVQMDDQHPDYVEFLFLSASYTLNHSHDTFYTFNETAASWNEWINIYKTLSSGEYTIQFVGRDTMGNSNSNVDLKITKDTEKPLISVISPITGTTYSSVTPTPELKAYVYDLNLKNVTVTINDTEFEMIYNDTSDCYEESSEFTAYYNMLQDGYHELLFYAVDYSSQES
ncbi:MAG: hypothetical protein GF364_07195, partial [Candidatus Lokiarchaeota archaeon]|nr:hypothetical protein [Candidatus Lokiarchaeota archaeon]